MNGRARSRTELLRKQVLPRLVMPARGSGAKRRSSSTPSWSRGVCGDFLDAVPQSERSATPANACSAWRRRLRMGSTQCSGLKRQQFAKPLRGALRGNATARYMQRWTQTKQRARWSSIWRGFSNRRPEPQHGAQPRENRAPAHAWIPGRRYAPTGEGRASQRGAGRGETPGRPSRGGLGCETGLGPSWAMARQHLLTQC